MRKWPTAITALRWCLILSASLALGHCAPFTTPPTPTVHPPSPTPSPTFAFSLPSATPTFTPAASLSPTPDLFTGLGPRLYQDRFNTNSGWVTGPTESGGVSLVEGRLSLAVHQRNTYLSIRSPVQDLSDFYLTISARGVLCGTGDEYGVMFRLNPEGEHYRFALTCEGKARLSRLLQEGEVALVPISETYAALSGRLVENQLGIWASGSHFRFYLNGVQIFTAQDGALASGGLGLFVRSRNSGQTTASFDDLIVSALLPTPTLPVTTPTASEP